MTARKTLNLTSLRSQVYEFLRDAINRAVLKPGEFIDQKSLSAEMGISRTPLRDALIQLEAEGFVTILPRRGVVVNRLDLDAIRHLYEIIGALEGAAVVTVYDRLARDDFGRLRTLNADMVVAIDRGDFDAYYDLNLRFHDTFLDRSDNATLVRTVNVCKQRLYDFPRPPEFLPEWELRSTAEHAEFLDLLEAGDARLGADYLRDVHWGFEVQRPFVLQYYFGGAAA
jgi:DNA-binding GntR family transcriptional regulator